MCWEILMPGPECFIIPPTTLTLILAATSYCMSEYTNKIATVILSDVKQT